MFPEILWWLICTQIAMGAFDTVYHHEFTERLAWRPSQARELRLHAVRNWLYSILFLMLGWSTPHGMFAIAGAVILLVEVVITLMDFVEEDLSRKLPASERITHTLLALNYGAVLVLLAPVLQTWIAAETSLTFAYHGVWSWLCAAAAIGTALFGLRDLLAARRSERLPQGGAQDLIPRNEDVRTVLVTGATGFVGRRLVEALVESGHRVIALLRDPAKGRELPTPISLVTSLSQIPSDTKIDAIVNLAGEPIADHWWTQVKRDRIVQSRVDVTRAVVALAARLHTPPEVLISGSAIGWYGLRDGERLNEGSGSSPCFSHDICVQWEAEAKRVRPLGVRLVLLRIGLVLGLEGGVLSRLLVPFEFCLGGRIGSGRQWMSWISRDDLVRLIGHAITTRSMHGRVNATAPHPVTNAAFSRALGTALSRPSRLAMPESVVARLGGQMACELLLGGQRVFPLMALANGFRFRHATIDVALAEMFGRSERLDVGADPAALIEDRRATFEPASTEPVLSQSRTRDVAPNTA